jgi:hypothetical protein
MSGFFQDIHNTFRTMAKTRGFTAIAILTLALGIGANSAIFSVVNAVVLQPLPFKNADRLVGIWEVRPGYERYAFTIPDYLDYRDAVADTATAWPQFLTTRHGPHPNCGRGERFRGTAILARSRPCGCAHFGGR